MRQIDPLDHNGVRLVIGSPIPSPRVIVEIPGQECPHDN